MTALILQPASCTVTATSLALRPGSTRDNWLEVGDALGRLGRAYQFWVGDWLNHGIEAGYIDRERYDEAERLFPGLSRKTLQDYAYVARESSIRIEDLSFAHHQAVASLGDADQGRWLSSAQANGWSVGQLRKQLQGRNGHNDRECCPTCGRPLPTGG